MRCRQCHHCESKVIESRETKAGATVRRRRECRSCGFRFTTFETTEDMSMAVIKKDGRRENFDRHKLLRSMVVACQKRKVGLRELKAVADWVERTALSLEDREIPSTRIGELVLEVLRNLDEVAYVRFASVYRAFAGPEDFVLELKKLDVGQQNSPRLGIKQLREDQP